MRHLSWTNTNLGFGKSLCRLRNEGKMTQNGLIPPNPPPRGASTGEARPLCRRRPSKCLRRNRRNARRFGRRPISTSVTCACLRNKSSTGTRGNSRHHSTVQLTVQILCMHTCKLYTLYVNLPMSILAVVLAFAVGGAFVIILTLRFGPDERPAQFQN